MPLCSKEPAESGPSARAQFHGDMMFGLGSYGLLNRFAFLTTLEHCDLVFSKGEVENDQKQFVALCCNLEFHRAL